MIFQFRLKLNYCYHLCTYGMQVSVSTETKTRFFKIPGHIICRVSSDGIGVCSDRVPLPISTLISCPCKSQSKKAKIVSTETILTFFFEKIDFLLPMIFQQPHMVG